MTTTEPLFPFNRFAYLRDEYRSERAADYLNIAAALHITPADAARYAFNSIDDPIDAPTTDRDDSTIMRAIAANFYGGDDDFDSFIHELDHTLDECAALIAADQHPLCCDCPDCSALD